MLHFQHALQRHIMHIAIVQPLLAGEQLTQERVQIQQDNEHLWRHISAELADFQMPTYEWDTGTPIDVLRTGSHPHMLLNMLNELFYMYRGVGQNDADGQHVVA